jgi:hypothetical protein
MTAVFVSGLGGGKTGVFSYRIFELINCQESVV